MTVTIKKKNPSDQKRSVEKIDLGISPTPDLKVDLENATPHSTSGSEVVYEIGKNTSPTTLSISTPDLSFNPKLPNPKPSFSDLNEQVKIDIENLYAMGTPYKSICSKLKNKYGNLYTKTKEHWENKKKGSGTKDSIDESFKLFIPVLFDMGFKPDGVQQIDQKTPGAGYKLGNVKWATPAENMANKCSAPHNQPLVLEGIAKPSLNLSDAEKLFNGWYSEYSTHFPDAIIPKPTTSVLKRIANQIAGHNLYDILKIIPMLIERWHNEYYSARNEINADHGCKLPESPTLSSVCHYITEVMLFMPPVLKDYESKYGTFLPKWAKAEAAAKEALIIKSLKEQKLKLIGLKMSALAKTKDHPYVLSVLLACDPALPDYNKQYSFNEMFKEFSQELELTDEEYRAFRNLYTQQYTPEKKHHVKKMFDLWEQGLNGTLDEDALEAESQATTKAKEVAEAAAIKAKEQAAELEAIKAKIAEAEEAAALEKMCVTLQASLSYYASQCHKNN
jgi:hypothetical protein